MATTPKQLPPQKPRNFVAKNALGGGAGAHKDKKKAIKQGDTKHKSKSFDMAESVVSELAPPTLKNYITKRREGPTPVTMRDAGNAVTGIRRAKEKIHDKETVAALKSKGDPRFLEAEGDPEGVPHITKELLQNIVQQVETEGAHAIVKSLQWGDGASKELLRLIVSDLKKHIGQDVEEGKDPCWKDYKQVGTKQKDGKPVPNCVPKLSEDSDEEVKKLQIDLWELHKDVTGYRPRQGTVDWTHEQWHDPEFLKAKIQQLLSSTAQQDAYTESLSRSLTKLLK